jgi:hypothetical protein
MTHMQTTEKIPKSYPIGVEGFQSNSREISEMWNLYTKNIMFICSLLTSTSTWYSDYHNGPGRYMSRELKSENINKKKAPTQRSNHPAKHYSTIPLNTTTSQKDIIQTSC